jgi:ferritin-like metal-binding protein YciE
MEKQQVQELLLQALETEIGGQSIYQTAIECAVNEELRSEWQQYLEETQNHERVLRDVFSQLNLDPEESSPGRKILHEKAQSLVRSMQQAQQAGDPALAQLVAAEAVVEAETKDHQNWRLIGLVAEQGNGDFAKVLKTAHEEVEDEEDEHLYHTMGWARELWIDSLGFKAVLPPPEEEKDVRTAIGAARAEQARDKML